MSSKTRNVVLASFVILALSLLVVFGFQPHVSQRFDGYRALEDVEYQVTLGPRIPGSVAHEQAVTWVAQSLRSTGWQVDIQETERLGKPIQNIIAKRGDGQPWLILGAHYDSRMLADQDPDPRGRDEPVSGANDGASGVAVLLELARVLPRNLDKQIWLVFFDAEDNGRIEGWDWILGSRAFVESLNNYPDGVVIVDMIGDMDLQIYLEANSDENLRQQIWQQAAELGHSDIFIDDVKHSMLDDHTPFLELGIPAVDIIDFDYPYWHTRADTLDKVSAESLQVVGETLLAWVISQ
ncbi:MAG: M28 family peptidase [Chloroflexi bacterium]|nr:M28 family peptidase [Chloroflexota bacterium]